MFVYRWEWIDSGFGPYSADVANFSTFEHIRSHEPPLNFKHLFDPNCRDKVIRGVYRYSWSTKELAENMFFYLHKALDFGFRLMKYEVVGDDYMVLPDGQVLFIDANFIEVVYEDKERMASIKEKVKNYETWDIIDCSDNSIG